MSDDGADLGYGPVTGLTAVLGGEQPMPGEAMTPEQMRAKILASPIPTSRPEEPSDSAYEADAYAMARLFLEAMERLHPDVRQQTALEPLYEQVRNERIRANDAAGLGVLLQMTGFMVGWAFNAAHFALGLPPAPNPAIMEVDV